MRTLILFLFCSGWAFAGTQYPRLTSFNSPVSRVNSSSSIVLTGSTNASSYVTNSDFYYQQTEIGSGTSGYVWMPTNSAGVTSVVANNSADTVSGGIVTYAQSGNSDVTIKVSDLAVGVTSGTTMTATNVFASSASTNRHFGGYVVGSLAHHIFTNLTARTNGRTMALWTTYPSSIATKSNFVRNPNCFLVGISNLTAISQCNEFQGARGQLPVTALTRRHGYARGHGFGVDPQGSTPITNSSGFYGNEVIFVGHDNTIVTMLVSNKITWYSGGYDYSILIFTADIPNSITPMKVVSNVSLAVPSRYPYNPTNTQLTLNPPHPRLHTEQAGQIDTSAQAYGSVGGLAGFTYPSWKGGDSGSPDMILVGTNLLFYGGRSCSGPSAHMQGAMDALSTLSGLTPASYQMEWADLTAYPEYP